MRILPVLCRPLAAPLVLLLAAAPLQAQGSGSAPGAGSGFAVGHAQSTGSLFSLHRVSTDTSTAAGSSLRLRTRTNAVAPLALDVSKFVFTAPGRAAASRTQTVERSFTFTPARTGRNGVSVGISTAATVAPTAATAAAASGQLPSAYNFDLSVGYRGFALSGGLSRADGGLAGRDQEAVNVGIGYDARRWRAGVSAMAERSFPNLLPDALSPDSRYAVEARGALDLTSRISLGGSLRYRAAPQHPTPLDPNRDDRAVMLGGAVTF